MFFYLYEYFFIEASPSGKATDSDSVIPRFESLCLSINGLLAQLVEQLTLNQ